MTAYEFFSKAEECEKAAAEIYAHLGAVFGADPEIGGIFERLAAEEIQHAARVRLLGSRHVHDAGLFQSASSLPDVDAALEAIQGARADALAGRWGTDLAGVMRRAAEMEDRLGHFHAEAITVLVQPELHGFFSTLLRQDRQHRALLWGVAARGGR